MLLPILVRFVAICKPPGWKQACHCYLDLRVRFAAVQTTGYRSGFTQLWRRRPTHAERGAVVQTECAPVVKTSMLGNELGRGAGYGCDWQCQVTFDSDGDFDTNTEACSFLPAVACLGIASGSEFAHHCPCPAADSDSGPRHGIIVFRRFSLICTDRENVCALMQMQLSPM
jgi:hypothetical protein